MTLGAWPLSGNASPLATPHNKVLGSGGHTLLRTEPVYSTCQAHRRGWARTWPPICIHFLSTVLPPPLPRPTQISSLDSYDAPLVFLVTSQEP